MEICGLAPMAQVDAELPVTCRMLDHGPERILFVFNHARQSGAAHVVPAADFTEATTLYTDPASGLDVVDDTGLDLTLSAKGVVVLRLTA
jgi:hypothetical protein